MYSEEPWTIKEIKKSSSIKTNKPHKSRKPQKPRKSLDEIKREAVQRYKKEVLHIKTINIFGWEINIKRKSSK